MIIEFNKKVPQFNESNFIAENATLIGDVVLGQNSSVYFNSVLRGDSNRILIGENSVIEDMCMLHVNAFDEDIIIGDRVTLGHKVMLHGCKIEHDTLIGMGAIVLDGAHIGHHSLVAAGSLVTEKMEIPPYSLVVGSPAKVLRKVSDKNLKMIDFTWKFYVNRSKEFMLNEKN